MSDSQNQNGSNTRDEFSTNIGDDSSLRSKRTFALLRESDRKPIILYEGKKDFRQISDEKVTPATALDFNNRSQSKKTNDPDSLIDLSQTNINDSIDNDEQILFKRSGSLNSPSKQQQFSHPKRALLFGRSNSIEESPGEENDEPITERKKSNFHYLKQAVAKVTAVKTIENEYLGVMVQQKKRKEKKGHNFLHGIEKGKVRMTKERPSSKQSGNSAAQKAANEESTGNHLVLDLTDDEVEEGHSRTLQIGPQPQQRQEEGDITVENFDEIAKAFY
ncbi:hypothetical protein FGO68_gene15238 [Halteria grandinella]|uniref:Uncharacterized protein n=1 Tax=Halteria grandinella TaxID=5974 RepID=A0A8J8P9Y5_HALGN|nr:hypothetical protein FGO68_gene15238 [Halteria grandinella]